MTHPEIPFPAHTSERTADGSSQVAMYHAKFSGDCKKLMQFWQGGKWYWLSNDDGRRFHLSSYLSARCYDLRKAGVPIDDRWHETPTSPDPAMCGKTVRVKVFRLRCTCRVVGGKEVPQGCWVHDKQLNPYIHND